LRETGSAFLVVVCAGFPSPAIDWLLRKFDTGGEVESVGPAPPRGRDKSGPYALDIASLVVFGQFATNIKFADLRKRSDPIANALRLTKPVDPCATIDCAHHQHLAKHIFPGRAACTGICRRVEIQLSTSS
jgi:hypothetical protein